MRRMAEAVTKAGVIAMAAHVERFEAGSAGLKTAIDQGVCGQCFRHLRPAAVRPGGGRALRGQSSTLRVLGIHDFDLVRWLHPGRHHLRPCDGGPGCIHAEHGMDDHVVTTITFADGAMASVESGWTLPPPTSPTHAGRLGARREQPARGFRRCGLRVE
jgi:predicted dehydrogenase